MNKGTVGRLKSTRIKFKLREKKSVKTVLVVRTLAQLIRAQDGAPISLKLKNVLRQKLLLCTRKHSGISSLASPSLPVSGGERQELHRQIPSRVLTKVADVPGFKFIVSRRAQRMK
jgi:hypothetical protein